MKNTNLFVLDEVIGYAWGTFKKKPLKIVGFFLLVYIICFLNSFLFPLLFSGLGNSLLILVIPQVEGWIVNYIADIAIVAFVLSVLGNKKSFVLKSLTDPKLILNVVLGSLLGGLIVILGFILLVVPGIYFAIRLTYVIYFLVDQKTGPIEAIKRSWKLTKGHFFSILGLYLVLVLVNLFGMLLLLLGLLITIPVTYIAIAYTYKKLSKN